MKNKKVYYYGVVSQKLIAELIPENEILSTQIANLFLISIQHFEIGARVASKQEGSLVYKLNNKLYKIGYISNCNKKATIDYITQQETDINKFITHCQFGDLDTKYSTSLLQCLIENNVEQYCAVQQQEYNHRKAS